MRVAMDSASNITVSSGLSLSLTVYESTIGWLVGSQGRLLGSTPQSAYVLYVSTTSNAAGSLISSSTKLSKRLGLSPSIFTTY